MTFWGGKKCGGWTPTSDLIDNKRLILIFPSPFLPPSYQRHLNEDPPAKPKEDDGQGRRTRRQDEANMTTRTETVDVTTGATGGIADATTTRQLRNDTRLTERRARGRQNDTSTWTPE